MTGIAITFIAGIAAFRFFPYFPFSISIVMLISAACLFLFPSVTNSRKIVLTLVCIAGFGYSLIRAEVPQDISFPDQDLIIEGTIDDVPEIYEDRLRIAIHNVIVEGTYIPGKIRAVIVSEMSGIEGGKLIIEPGDRIIATARLRAPVPYRNPGVYSHDLKQDGISAVGYIKRLETIKKEKGLRVELYRKRQRLGKILDNSLSPESASFYKAVIPGLKRGISQKMRDAFSAAGLAHLLSISGTHFGLLAFIFYSFTRLIVRSMPIQFLRKITLFVTPTQIAVIVTFPLLLIYAVFSGLSTPSVRSLIMVFIFMLALLLGRKGQWLNSLSIASLVILLLQPGSLFDLSFLLSFSAVFFIGSVLEYRATQTEDPMSLFPMKGRASWRYLILRGFQKVHTSIVISIAAVAGTAPLTAIYFKQCSLISPLANLIVTPLVCFVLLPIGFLSSFSALMWNMASMPLSGLIDRMTILVFELIKGLSNLPFSNVPVRSPSVVLTLLYYLSLFIIVKSRRKGRIIPLVIVLCAYTATPLLSEDALNVTFLDVGQGDASVVELPGKKIMLIDGGSSDPDMGRMVIAPFLWGKGIRAIDYMVISHPHPDHFGGLAYLLGHFDVKEIWANGRTTPELSAFIQEAAEKRIPYRTLRRGDMLEAKRYRITVLHPYDEFRTWSPRGEFSDENSGSLVLKLESEGRSFLFPGDIEQEAEENILHLGPWIKSDIIKIPHHGGRTSSSREFIEAVGPRIAVASVGKNNPFGHPHNETVSRYEDAHVRMFRTDMDGAVVIRALKGHYDIGTYKDFMVQKVHHWRDETGNLRLLF